MFYLSIHAAFVQERWEPAVLEFFQAGKTICSLAKLDVRLQLNSELPEDRDFRPSPIMPYYLAR